MSVDNGKNNGTDTLDDELNYWKYFQIIFVVLFCLMVVYRLIFY